MARSPKTTVLTRILIAASLLGAISSYAKLTPSKKLTKSPNAVKCSRTALQLKNCYLKLDKYSVRVWKQKMSVSDKVSRSLVDLPLAGDKVDWVAGEIEKLGDAYFVQWIAWEAPAEKSDIQTKMWYVYRLENEKAELVLSQPLVKRIRTEGAKPKSDDEAKFGLRLEKKTPTWFFGKEKGVLK